MATTVEVELILKAQEFHNELKKASTDANKFNKGLKDIKKAGGKEDKDLQKLAKDANKFNKRAAEDAIQHETKLLSIIRKRHAEMAKIKDINSKEFKQLRKEAAEATELYSDLSTARAAAEKGEPGKGKASKFGRALYNGLVTGAQRVTGMAVGALTQRVSEAGQAALQFKAGAINLAGDPEIKNMRDLQSLAIIGAKDTGYGTEETLAQAAAMARATGHGADVTTGQQFARGGMLEMGQATSFMGLQARGGLQGAEAKRDLERIMTNAFANGLEKGRFGEYLEGLTGLLEGAQGRFAGEVSGADYAKSLSILDESGYSGLRGARGAKVLSQLEQGFMGGGGAAGKAMSLMAMGYGTPGGTSSLYEAEKGVQRGFAGPGGVDNMLKMIQNFRYQYGGDSQATVRAMGAQTGISYDILEQVLNATKTGTPEEIKKRVGALTAGAEPLDKQMLDVIKGDLAAEAKTQSNLQTELLAQGLQAAPALKDIQAAINKMIDVTWPLALEALDGLAAGLKLIATAIKDAVDWWKELPMFKATPYSEMSLEQRAVVDSKQLGEDVIAAVSDNTMGREEGIKLLREEEAINEKRRQEAIDDHLTSTVADEYKKAAQAAANARVSLGDTSGTSEYSVRAMAEVEAQRLRELRLDQARQGLKDAETKAAADAKGADYVARAEAGEQTLHLTEVTANTLVKIEKKMPDPGSTPKAKGAHPSGRVSPVTRSGKPK